VWTTYDDQTSALTRRGGRRDQRGARRCCR